MTEKPARIWPTQTKGVYKMEVIIGQKLYPSNSVDCPCSVGIYRFKFNTDEKPKWDCFSKNALLSFQQNSMFSSLPSALNNLCNSQIT